MQQLGHFIHQFIGVQSHAGMKQRYPPAVFGFGENQRAVQVKVLHRRILMERQFDVQQLIVYGGLAGVQAVISQYLRFELADFKQGAPRFRQGEVALRIGEIR